MCAWQPESQPWPDKKALLFVHGVGNSNPGDYDDLVNNFKQKIGPELASKLAIYFLYYDDLNDWMVQKSELADNIDALKGVLKSRLLDIAGESFAGMVADFAGDVIFPVLNEASRLMIRERYLAQVKQIRLDGHNAGIPFLEQEISIICHSLGCFHTYEMLHAAANKAEHRLLPATDAMQFANVIFMASPVQLIRSVAQWLGPLVPKREFATSDSKGLFIPSETDLVSGSQVSAARNVAEITGTFDPIGGYILGRKLDWAYMLLQGAREIVEEQTLFGDGDEEEGLKNQLAQDKEKGAGPQLPVNNPHSWDRYIANNKEELKQWLNG